jgi:hypothetical protein
MRTQCGYNVSFFTSGKNILTQLSSRVIFSRYKRPACFLYLLRNNPMNRGREESEFEKQHLDDLSKICIKSGTIAPEMYQKYSVKRGLRNADGTGVLVGLTRIGNVHGYILDENEKMPVDGRLSYRGIDVEEMVRGFQAEKRHGFHETIYLLLFGVLPTK